MSCAEVAGKESYSKPDILNVYLCELPRLASKPGKSLTPVEVWFDILQNMSNFATKPEIYGKKYDPIFESSLQSPIPDKDKLQYFRSMFDDDVRSYLTDEDREEIAQEFFAKGVEKVIRQLKANGHHHIHDHSFPSEPYQGLFQKMPCLHVQEACLRS